MRSSFKILIGCECSGAIRDAFIKRGFNAISCDLKPSETEGPHIQGDLLEVITDDYFDMMIGHPVCKFLAHSGAQWFWHPEDNALRKHLRRPHPLYPERRKDQEKGIAFFKALWNAPIDLIGLENPKPLPELIHSVGRYSQIVQPWHFGDSYQKSTCLWLKGLPKLKPTKIVDRGEMLITSSGKKIPKWYSDAKSSSGEQTETDRSRTFPGMAAAMAEQWGDYLIKSKATGSKIFHYSQVNLF